MAIELEKKVKENSQKLRKSKERNERKRYTYI